MSPASQSLDALPDVTLRVPGPWNRPEALAARLPAGFSLKDGGLLTVPGRSFWLQFMPADDQFPNVFRIACRRGPLRPEEDRQLDRYVHNVGLSGKGGSLLEARRLLDIAAGLIAAGGYGVFIDNSLLAHSAEDWQELAEHAADPQAVFWAFVNVVHFNREVLSRGMQVLGWPDGVVDRLDDIDSLEDFLRATCAEERMRQDGEEFVDTQGNRFQVRCEPERAILPNHPANNPYGRWRLVPIARRARSPT